MYNTNNIMGMDVKVLDNRYYDRVMGELIPFFEENGFQKQDDGSYRGETRAVAVSYDDARQMYTLSVAVVEEGEVGEMKEINAWLFDDSQTEKDAESVGIDFLAELRKIMGIKITRSGASAEVELPTFSKTGSITVTGFTKKLLDFFPSLKDEYKDHVAASSGNYLYLYFFGESVVPKFKNLLLSGNKKQIKKLFDLFEDMYVKGDKETVNMLLILLCAAAKDEKAKAVIEESLAENTHFLMAFQNLLPAFLKNKKLYAVLIKE